MAVGLQHTQPEADEYDEYNVSFDVEILPYIVDLPPSQDSQEKTLFDSPLVPDVPASPKSTYSDEFSRYDFSEFTAAELAALDHRCSPTQIPKDTSYVPSAAPKSPAATLAGNLSSGPEIEIEIERPADCSMAGQTPIGGVIGEPPIPPVAPSSVPSVAEAGPSSAPFTNYSHFSRFRKRNKTLSVTDLTGPAWCEVQYEYGLLQKRSRKLENRPAAFATSSGKVIHVDKQRARSMDKISKRGQAVHKKLEREIHPEPVPVTVATPEEKWAVRLLSMIECLQSLVAIGRCREMPVFGILQGQPIVGFIDEIERRAVAPPPPSTARASPETQDRKRERADASVPATPSKPQSKRARRSPSPSQPAITAFFSPRPHSQSDTVAGGEAGDGPARTPRSQSRAATPPRELPPRSRLYLADTKTRSTPTVPPEEDTLSARLQLMFYHRLLSHLLVDPASSSESLDLGTFWSLVDVSPTRPFSERFKKEAGLSDPADNLADIERMWRAAVEMLHVDGVDDGLAIIYRTQEKKARKKGKAAATRKSHAGVDGLSEKEQADLAAAVKASLADHGIQLDDAGLAPIVEETVAGVAASGKRVQSGDTDPLEQGIPASHNPPADVQPEGMSISSDEGEGEAPPPQSTVIGTKEFTVDAPFLDGYLSSILEFWYGKRPPRGVDVGLTRRCDWCEYHDGCEWREMKSQEVRRRAEEKAQQARG